MVGGVVWRAVQSGPGRCTKEQAFLLLELLVHPKCTLPLLSPLVIIQHCGALCTPPFQSATFSGSIMSGGSLCDLPLLQLSVTSRMVAEKWPHKKAIKEHKGSESRAQCDISRKWDICVHGARPTSDMFTRVQGGRCNPDRMWDVTLGKRLQSVDNTATRDSTARKGLSGRWRRGKANDWGSSTCGGQG